MARHYAGPKAHRSNQTRDASPVSTPDDKGLTARLTGVPSASRLRLATMRRRALGRSGIEVSEIGFGSGPTAGLMIYGTVSEQAASVALAYELGIDYFDTAPIYGDFVSEENLGRALQAAAIRPHLATKVALELSDLDDIPRAVRRSVEDSLRRLRVETVTSVQVHNRVGQRRAPRSDLGVGALLTPDDVLGPVLHTLQELRAEGKLQAIGCCAWGGEYQSVCEVLNSGAFDTVLVGYSLLNPTSGRAAPSGFRGRDFGNVMEVARANGTSSVVLRVLESGALAGVSAPHPVSSQARQPGRDFADNVARARALRFLVREGQTMAQAAIRFALADPRVAVVLVGFSERDQVSEAAAAANDERLSEVDLTRLEAVYASVSGPRGGD
jgi:D-threo-aldose 1-dehydrogenase